MVPSGWNIESLGSVTNKVGSGVTPRGGSNSYKSSGIPLIRSQNILWGKLDLSDVAYIDDKQHNKMKGSFVYKDDVLLNITGASIGRVAVSNIDEANVNQHVCIIRSDKLDSGYLKSFLLSFEGQKQVEQCQAGGNRQGLNFEQIKSFKIPFPPLPEQQKIAKILSTWDNAINATERLIDNSTEQKKALMQQLLTGKKRLLDDEGKRFSDKWKKVELGKLLDYKQPTPYLVKSTDYSDEYITPVLTAGKTFILGYTDEKFGIFREELPVIIFDDFTTASKFVNFPFKAKSSAMKMLTAKDGVSIKYVFEAMQFLNFAVGGHQRHWISIFANLAIPLPSLKEQQEIATVLTNADKEIELLEQQLADLQQEKKALMQVLLTGKKRVVVDGEVV